MMLRDAFFLDLPRIFSGRNAVSWDDLRAVVRGHKFDKLTLLGNTGSASDEKTE